ncbi:MAG: hypothetical protein KC478_07235 [Bacteriovoracaceae bacterium]|nr:hypothetical protein [Bacteriovoracaceae bacterium]
MLRTIALFILLTLSTGYSATTADASSAMFSGRVSLINKDAKLMRVKIDFANARYLKSRDRVEFWNETYPEKKCLSYVEGRSSEYLLVKIPQYTNCVSNVHLTVGTYLRLYSQDLESSLKVGADLVDILLKKRLALRARLLRHQKALDGFVEKVDALNKRYEVLRQKLEIEWQQELAALEEDKTENYMSYKHSQARLNELEHKLQKYRIEDQNLVEDRWSLDPKLYFKK